MTQLFLAIAQLTLSTHAQLGLTVCSLSTYVNAKISMPLSTTHF